MEPDEFIRQAIDEAEPAVPAPDDAALAKLPRNDTGNADRLIARHGHEMAWVDDIGWIVWDGKRWARERGEAEALRRAKQTVRAMRDEAWTLGDDEADDPKAKASARAAHLKFVVSSGNSGKTKSILEMAQPELTRDLAEFDARHYHLNVLNGTIRLDAGCRLMPHRQSDMITRMARVAYDPKADCPKFRAYVDMILPDPRTALFVQKWLGYSLTGDITEQCFVMFDGRGSNGKSTLVGACAIVMGDYAQNAPIETFLHNDNRNGGGPSPDLARLPGVRMVRTSEPSKGARLCESRVKMWTGGEEVTARHLNRGFFDFVPCGKITMSCNVRPRIAGKDEGIKTRVLVVPFKYRFPRRSGGKKLKWDEKFAREEGPGILNWLLDGYRMWAEDGLDVPPEVQAATEEMFNDQDPVGQAVRAVLIDTGADEDKAQAMAVMDACKRYFKREGIEVKSDTAIGTRLVELGLRKRTIRGLRHYIGVKVNPDYAFDYANGDADL